jgi:ribosome maturation factor RimP
MTAIDLQQVQRDELSKQIDKLIRIVFRNKIGNRCTLVGFIKKIEDDFVIFEHNDNPKPHYKIRNIISFEAVKEKSIKEF